jgi:hypothetical protein
MTRKLLIKGGNCEEALVSYGRKFKTLFTTRAHFEVSGFQYFVTTETRILICVVGALCSALFLILRQRMKNMQFVARMISRVIEEGEANMILKTRMHSEYSTEYSHLTINEARKMFEDGCLCIRRAGGKVVDRNGQERFYPPMSITADALSIEKFLSLGLVLQSQTNPEDSPFQGEWHARWDKPPELRCDSWANQGRTQRISYDVVDLGRTKLKNHIRYVCAAEVGLNTGWVDFCHLENDGLPNILRGWDETFEVVRIWDISLMKSPSGRYMWVPDYNKYKEHYIEQHRIKAIADQITLTMKTGGSWCEATFKTSYKSVVSGNSSTNMGHKLPTMTAKRYLPQVTSLVRAHCCFPIHQ